jgi:hypothetical protein
MEHPKNNEKSGEIALPAIESLLPKLDFYETPDLAEARRAILEALSNNDLDPASRQEMWAEYAKIGEQITDALDAQDIEGRARTHIALIVHKAMIFRDADNLQRYLEELDDAEIYAASRHLDVIAESLRDEIDSLYE